MSQGNSKEIIYILAGRGFRLQDHPGREKISRPGYYLDSEKNRIEHWSHLCSYNAPMRHHFANQQGLIEDGFQSLEPFDDIDDLLNTLTTWNRHLKKYGVIQ
jgi:hypothetical protein